MDVRQFRELVVRPTLAALNLPHPDRAEALLIATACHESAGLRYIKQVGGGPALSFYQIEPATGSDVIDRWLTRQSRNLRDMVSIVAEFRAGDDIKARLLCDMRFATVVARLIYYRAPEALPKADDVPAMAKLWKLRWNTHLGAGTEQQFISNYERFVR